MSAPLKTQDPLDILQLMVNDVVRVLILESFPSDCSA